MFLYSSRCRREADKHKNRKKNKDCFFCGYRLTVAVVNQKLISQNRIFLCFYVVMKIFYFNSIFLLQFVDFKNSCLGFLKRLMQQRIFSFSNQEFLF